MEGEEGVEAIKSDRDFCSKGSEKEGEDTRLRGESGRVGGEIVERSEGKSASEDKEGTTGGGKGVSVDGGGGHGNGNCELASMGEVGTSKDTRGELLTSANTVGQATIGGVTNPSTASRKDSETSSKRERDCE